ncbi:ATP-dependent Clp protease ATP-binding subunit ClpC [Thermosporothrix hazakensis]|uniref:ATP-dependent Clp protease ATP-binding subunit ClpC n=1 Tax=Thermosporothrix hazakensis TaxID=644383 RepID=A0A326UEN6_THEHA|nr:ATP-dependent Clp protease ATP-binding subunit [Thermosporothrix hazakensis]PZW36504.1 ATP-dependent Clp protease ATP-binding subunit ClpC [Thermosporothrix hazakensis]GCE47157.1 ATP-dependent Clp protease ATP-binding subunit ClpC [Thermosporothrix hazakensis]
MKCERCHKNPARVRVEQVIDGRREAHFLCQSCVDEIMNAMGQMGGGMDGVGPMGGGFPFGFNMGGGKAASSGNVNTATAERQGKHSKTPTLDQYGRDLTAEAAEGKLDPAAGRERELRRLVTVLGRRQKNNPVLIGEPGVGKTAIVEGLARRIQDGKVPPHLRNKRIVSLNIGGMVAGAMFRGQFEQRIKSILEELRENPDTIVFIDELHTVVGAGAAEGAVGAGDMIKPALARGELRCIGATTLDEYRKHIEKDAALERRFQPIMVNEPTVEEAEEMLKIVRPNYEAHHGVSITDEAIEAAVKLSDRYINDRFLPDKAIDVIDEAGSSLRLEASEKGIVTPTLIEDLEKELADIQSKKEAAANAEDYERAALMRQQELLTLSKLEKARAQMNDDSALTVTPEHVARVIEAWTGVPVSQMLESERQNLRNLEQDLRKRVIGQNEAISAVARAIRRSRAGLKDPKRPIGSFLFLGPTGVGKTELAKALAAELFGGEDNMLRFDMSEYMEPHTVSRLFGSPPGYVGHDEGGQLTERVRRRPYSVILFDEIEKAHPEVFNALLQIMDDGRLTDGQGRTVDFKNTVVIMTSNVGTSDLKRAAHLGFVTKKGDSEREEKHEEMRSKALEGLRRVFRPEFVNRIDQIVVFHSLGKEELNQIVDLMLEQVRERLREQKIELVTTDAVREFLLKEGFNEEFGARPLRRAIQTHVDDVLADALLAGEIASDQKVVLDVQDGKVVVSSPEMVQN